MFSVTPSDLICDVPLTRNFNIAAPDGNTAYSLHNYKAVHICFRFVPLFVTKHFHNPGQCTVCHRCSVMLHTAGQPSQLDSVITDFKKYYWKNCHHEFLPVEQLLTFPDKTDFE